MYALEIVEHAVEAAANALARPEGQIALGSAALASAFAVGGTFVKTMIPLRWLAVGTNLGFMVYGALYPQLPLMVLHALLLPINLYRAAEMVRLSRRVNAAVQARDTLGLWLRPYMKRLKLKAGTVLFRKGDLADHLYMLASGRIELVEIGVDIPAGRVFGRDRLLRARPAAHDDRRAASKTVRCWRSTRALCASSTTRTPSSASS